MSLHKLVVSLSIELKTGLDYLMGLSLFDILDLCEDLKDINHEIKVRTKRYGK